MSVAALTVRRLSGCPVVSLAMLCLLFLAWVPLWSAARPAAGGPISGSAVTPNSLYPGGYPGGSGVYPGGSGVYPGGSGVYPGGSGVYPGGSGGYPGGSGAYPGGSSYYPSGTYKPPGTLPSYGSSGNDACTLCYWKNYYSQWYRQVYAAYEQMGYDPCYVCQYGYYSGR